MNFSEDQDVGNLYLSTKFEIDRSIDNIYLYIGQESLET